MVKGLGEIFVGVYLGCVFSFVIKKFDMKNLKVFVYLFIWLEFIVLKV